MNYKETVEFMFSQLPMFQNVGQKALNNKLDKSIALDEYFKFPHKLYKCIHVGGTNGKGSVSHLLASVLQSSGYKVGLYTSPHLKDFRERIKVNGEPCEEQFVVNFIEQHQGVLHELKPSFFEMTVAMAFQYFKEQEVDIAVIEVGLGGRLDSTNIINPILSVITNISIDHTAMLGGDLESIAREKAGIIKKEVPVVIGEYQEEVMRVFEKVADEQNASICYAGKQEAITNVRKSLSKVCFDWGSWEDITCPLSASYQKKNIQTSLIVLKILKELLGLSITEDSLREGFDKVVEQTHFKGRWQVLGTEPLVVCDTAHNEAGLRCAMEELKALETQTLHIVYGTSADKDIEQIFPLLPNDAEYYFTEAKVQRAMPVRELHDKAKKYGLNGECFESVSSALDSALAKANKEDVVYVGGSIFVVAELNL